jgi:hypothetical protein
MRHLLNSSLLISSETTIRQYLGAKNHVSYLCDTNNEDKIARIMASYSSDSSYSPPGTRAPHFYKYGD